MEQPEPKTVELIYKSRQKRANGEEVIYSHRSRRVRKQNRVGHPLSFATRVKRLAKDLTDTEITAIVYMFGADIRQHSKGKEPKPITALIRELKDNKERQKIFLELLGASPLDHAE